MNPVPEIDQHNQVGDNPGFGELPWQEFYPRQEQVELAGVAHLPVQIRYIRAGHRTNNKGTVLLLHGIPTWSFLYRHTIDALVTAGYHVLAPDLLGHGFSDRRDKFDRSFQDQARMIIQLLRALQCHEQPVHVVGHDTGGAVALILAIEKVSQMQLGRLILTNIVCYDRFDDDMLDFGHPIRWQTKSIDDLREALSESLEMGLANKAQLTQDFAQGIMAPWLSPEGKLSLLRNASALNANQTMALVDRHGTIRVPTLVLWATRDPWQKWEDGQRLASEIPHAQTVTLDHASHWVQQDDPDGFNEAILEFLNQD